MKALRVHTKTRGIEPVECFPMGGKRLATVHEQIVSKHVELATGNET